MTSIDTLTQEAIAEIDREALVKHLQNKLHKQYSKAVWLNGVEISKNKYYSVEDASKALGMTELSLISNLRQSNLYPYLKFEMRGLKTDRKTIEIPAYLITRHEFVTRDYKLPSDKNTKRKIRSPTRGQIIDDLKLSGNGNYIIDRLIDLGALKIHKANSNRLSGYNELKEHSLYPAMGTDNYKKLNEPYKFNPKGS